MRELSLAHSQPFRFLDLSAELRDHVYEIAMEEISKQGPVPLQSSSDKPQLPTAAFPLLALTQTSRQIRKEFRPIYMLNTTVRLPIDKTAAYIAAFYPSSTPDSETIVSRLMVDMLPTVDCFFRPNTEILSLLDLLSRFPSARCQLICPSEIENPDAADKFRHLVQTVQQNSSAWRAALQNDIAAVTLYQNYQDDRTHVTLFCVVVQLCIKESCQEPWAQKVLRASDWGPYGSTEWSSYEENVEYLVPYLQQLGWKPEFVREWVHVRKGKICLKIFSISPDPDYD
ncbi:hypothetical protein K504DRAFT_456872 [Pleomassaria siparia CBS 279.74]|uniref:Uncharacterized protein n=1 Tax=Pleomassaria siparia CBS 279.74 TaxID=1314801 RepID=A0A6G1KQL0_9PLEO|nr:hypothetical protein K504DRAFT_456872 [Pleomassaria siparia CBS 279.74]